MHTLTLPACAALGPNTSLAPPCAVSRLVCVYESCPFPPPPRPSAVAFHTFFSQQLPIPQLPPATYHCVPAVISVPAVICVPAIAVRLLSFVSLPCLQLPEVVVTAGGAVAAMSSVRSLFVSPTLDGVSDSEVAEQVLALRTKHGAVGRPISSVGDGGAHPPLAFAINHSFGPVTYDVAALRRIRVDAGCVRTAAFPLCAREVPCEGLPRQGWRSISLGLWCC
jgi:hypothetical protein